MGRLFGTDGIRGTAGGLLTAELSLKVGRALGSILSEKRQRPLVLIGCDGRISADMLSSALAAGLMSAGCDVGSLSVIPTPAVAYLTLKYSADAGVVISASHNSFEYNGIKIFGADGFKIADRAEEKIESLVFGEAELSPPKIDKEIGRSIPYPTAARDYIDYLKAAFPLSLSGKKIALDGAYGAASRYMKILFSELSAETVTVGASPDGTNINAECGSTSPKKIAYAVTAERCEVGLAFDGDADRCIAVDEDGETVDGDTIMAIIADGMMARGELLGNTLVGTVMSNLGLKRFCEERGICFFETKVGDRYVSEKIVRGGYSLGGEQSGHVILRRHATTGDGLLTALALLWELSLSGKRLREAKKIIKKYPQYTTNVKADENAKRRFAEDGLLCDVLRREEMALGDGRILVRASGTEPLIRIMVEGETEEITKRAAENIKNALCSELEKL